MYLGVSHVFPLTAMLHTGQIPANRSVARCRVIASVLCNCGDDELMLNVLRCQLTY